MTKITDDVKKANKFNRQWNIPTKILNAFRISVLLSQNNTPSSITLSPQQQYEINHVNWWSTGWTAGDGYKKYLPYINTLRVSPMPTQHPTGYEECNLT
jgi:hypothetical protein